VHPLGVVEDRNAALHPLGEVLDSRVNAINLVSDVVEVELTDKVLMLLAR
jgi:hypothetical protein